MTNPNNAIGTPAAFSGRTSVKAYNNITNAFTSGIISGWGCSPVSGMTVAVGGTAGIRDIAVAEDASGNRTTISNISEAPVEITIDTAPTTYNRIDSIVLYVEPSPTGDSSTQDNPTACGIVAVKGTPAANAVAPDDAAIRSAITTDGGSGTTAYYVVITNITVGVGVTTITSGVISSANVSTNRAARLLAYQNGGYALNSVIKLAQPATNFAYLIARPVGTAQMIVLPIRDDATATRGGAFYTPTANNQLTIYTAMGTLNADRTELTITSAVECKFTTSGNTFTATQIDTIYGVA